MGLPSNPLYKKSPLFQGDDSPKLFAGINFRWTRIKTMRWAGVKVIDIAKAYVTPLLDCVQGTQKIWLWPQGQRPGGPRPCCGPELTKLARNSGMVKSVFRGLEMRWLPHAISADIRTVGECVPAAAIYRSCYLSGELSRCANRAEANMCLRRRSVRVAMTAPAQQASHPGRRS